MPTTRPTVTELADALLAAAPTLDPDEQRLVVGLYQALTGGAPVSPGALATQLGIPSKRVTEALDRWPGVFRNEAGEVIGFWGLALSGMPHDLENDGTTIKAWCALDPFLIAPLLETDLTRVTSKDPVTGEEVTLTITQGGLREISPETAVISMLAPVGEFDHEVVESFCHYVWFFASPESGRRWTADHPGTFLLTVEEADAVARRSWPKLVQHTPEQRF